MLLVILKPNFNRKTSNLIQILGTNHIMVVMPGLTKQYFVQRPTVLTNDDFIFYLHDKYFGDGGECGRLATDDYHTVHRTLNSLMKEPFLSTATGCMAELIGKTAYQLFSFSADPAKQLHWERIGRAVPVLAGGDHVEVDLFALTMNYIGDIAGEVLMGKAFFENNPNVLDDLWVFDDGFNALLSGAPPVTPKISRAKAARARLNKVFGEWNMALSKTLKGEDPGHQWRDMSDVSETMKMRTSALQGIGSSDVHNSATNLGVYWAMMVNANKVTFWLLLHIISNPSLLATIRAEIAPFATTTTTTDQKTPPHLSLDAENLAKSCPTLKAAFYEAMRLYTAGTAYKKVLQPVTLTESGSDAAALGKPRPQTYRVPAGAFLVVPGAAMQTDGRLWRDPERFDAGRFLIPADEKGGVRADVRHLNAFGGGHTVCKGRTFAEREVLLFVAGFLAVWEFAPVPVEGAGWRIPGKWYNGTGSASPAGPVRVRVGRRA